MIFFCFSSIDRHKIVEAMLFHITNYDVPVWYDRHKMLLGDDRDRQNFDEGVGQCNYAVIIVSPNSIASVCAREEIEMIHQRLEEGKMIVFPVFYNMKAIDIPEELHWMTDLVYKELDEYTDSRSACNHIICRILLDELKKYSIGTINDFLERYSHCAHLSYIVKIIQSYCRVNDENKNAQISLLYAACLYIKDNYSLSGIPAFYYTGVERLFDETRLHLPVDLRETLIFERLTLLLINTALFGYIH